MNGWPKSKNDVDLSVKPYYMIHDDLSYVHNLILKDQRIVVPTVLPQEMKETLHTGHSGIERCKRRARDTLYWPGINDDDDDDDKLNLTTLTLSAETGFHNGRVKKREQSFTSRVIKKY